MLYTRAFYNTVNYFPLYVVLNDCLFKMQLEKTNCITFASVDALTQHSFYANTNVLFKDNILTVYGRYATHSYKIIGGV